MKLKLKEIIGEAVGYGSMCWSEQPKGIFESSKASKKVDEATDKILELVNKRASKGVLTIKEIDKVILEHCSKVFKKGSPILAEKIYQAQMEKMGGE